MVGDVNDRLAMVGQRRIRMDCGRALCAIPKGLSAAPRGATGVTCCRDRAVVGASRSQLGEIIDILRSCARVKKISV